MTARLGDRTVTPVSPWAATDDATRLRRRRLLAAAGVVLVLETAFTGPPTGRTWLTLWVLVFVLAAVGGDLRAWRSAVVRDWLPLLSVLFTYDLLRGVANDVGARLLDLQVWRTNPDVPSQVSAAHLVEPVHADRWLFGGHVPTVWLQQHLFTPGTVRWWDELVVPVYLSHFVVALSVAVVLWCVGYAHFRRYLAALVTLMAACLATYVLYPAGPPWMASLNGQLPSVHRVVRETLVALGGSHVSAAVEKGAAYANPVAAVPSLHAAVPALLVVLFWRGSRWWVRWLLVAYALSMAFTLVYTGEHYAVDVLLGWAYAVGAVMAVDRFRRSLTPLPSRRP